MTGQTVHFHPAYLDAVRAGTKTTTVRFRDPVVPGPATLVFEDDGEVRLQAEVTRVVPCVLADLTDEDAVADGFRDRAIACGGTIPASDPTTASPSSTSGPPTADGSSLAGQ